MWVYFLVPGIWHEIEASETADKFFEWLAEDPSGVFTDLLRTFIGTAENLGGIGGTVDSEDDLEPLANTIRDRIAVIE